MDLSITDEQRDISKAVKVLVERTRDERGLAAELDRRTLDALTRAGYLDIVAAGGTSVDATFVIDEAAAAGVCAPVGARALVAPSLLDEESPQIVALADRTDGALVRFGAAPDLVLVLDGDVARVAGPGDVQVAARAVRWGYPVARVTVTGGRRLDAGSGAALLRLWRIALAAEAGGLMRAAVLHTTRHVASRVQFGRPIGSYQSVQHRLARGWVLAEGTTWLARQAAARPDDDVTAAAAACHACTGMREVLRSVHQVSGAMGITDEFGLTRLTAKLAYLHTELGGASGNARALARSRWYTRAA